MSGVYVNNQKSIYATDTRVNSLESQITEIQNDTSFQASQHFKSNGATSFINNLTVSTFVVIDGYDTQSTLPGSTDFSELNGIITYNGTVSNYYNLSFDISGIHDTNAPITFAIFRNSTVLAASAQIQAFSIGIYESISASVIIELQPGNTISIRGELNSGTTSIFATQNIKLSALKLANV